MILKQLKLNIFIKITKTQMNLNKVLENLIINLLAFKNAIDN